MFRLLHEVSPGCLILSHKIVPEVRAMLCAMVSRLPAGGLKARYWTVVEVVTKDLYTEIKNRAAGSREDQPSWADLLSGRGTSLSLRAWLLRGEERLCEYPIHPKVQDFIEEFVGKYGHSSILEQVGSPTVFVEDVSWLTNWMLFDSPLCIGQEFSTRAVRRKDWPMAKECYLSVEDAYRHFHGDEPGRSLQHAREGVNPPGTNGAEWLDPLVRSSFEERWRTTPDPFLQKIHEGWMAIFEAEVDAWRQEFQAPCPCCGGSTEITVFLTNDPPIPKTMGCPDCGGTGKKYPTADKEPFRPALDRARWALPGTIATGSVHTAHLRDRARVIAMGSALGKGQVPVWDDIAQAYREALPGMAPFGLKEAVYQEGQTNLHTHLRFDTVGDTSGVRVSVLGDMPVRVDRLPRTYLDPSYNNVRVKLQIPCSLAVARDWHRHRTLYPWTMSLVWEKGFVIQEDYTPISEYGKQHTPEMLSLSSQAYSRFTLLGDVYRALLTPPLGTKVLLEASGGLRDVVYALELRAFTTGANFEYKAQALAALERLEAFSL